MSFSLLSMIALNGSVDAVRLSLEASSAFWFGVVKYAGYAVAFGCALEAPETLVILKRWWLLRFKDKEREETIKEKKSWIVPLAAVGLLVIVAGIIVETYAEGKVSDADARLREHESDVISAAETKAADAETRLGPLEKGAAQLNKDAEDERTARIKIESAVAFRQLTSKQKEKLGNDLARFKELVGISFWYQANDAEAQLFGDDMAEALRAKGAIVQPPANFLSMKATGKYGDPIVGADTGVTVQSTKVGAAPEFALALIRELNDMGFDAKRQTDPPFDKDTKSPLVWVNVDARPKGPQGEYKLQAAQAKKAPATHK